MNKIVVFSGNRADFGILFPLLYSLNCHYQLELLLSGAHVLKKWETGRDVRKQLDSSNIHCHITEISLVEDRTVYKKCLSEIYLKTIGFFEVNTDFQMAVVLGDRIEAVGFALGVYYSQIPLLHLCGGDVAEVNHYDNNIRHCISKLADYHFVTNEKSKKVLLQMGEENPRVINIGNLSYDYDRLGFLASVKELEKDYGITQNDVIIIYTYHPMCDSTKEENYKEFRNGLEAAINSSVDKVIVTYPNNDPGYELILDYLDTFQNNEKVLCIRSLGTCRYLSFMKNYKTIIAGNSSSGLLETTLYCVPVLNIGRRQNGRVRGCNVTDVAPDYQSIKDALDYIVQNYDALQDKYKETKFMFGDGSAAMKAKESIDGFMKVSKDERIFKKFIERDWKD